MWRGVPAEDEVMKSGTEGGHSWLQGSRTASITRRKESGTNCLEQNLLVHLFPVSHPGPSCVERMNRAAILQRLYWEFKPLDFRICPSELMLRTSRRRRHPTR